MNMSVSAADVKKVLDTVKKVQGKIRSTIENGNVVEEVRKYAEAQGAVVKKLLGADLKKLTAFVERERGQLEKLAEKLPGEIAKVQTFLKSQRGEVEKLIRTVAKNAAGAAKVRTKVRSAKKSAAKRTVKTTAEKR